MKIGERALYVEDVFDLAFPEDDSVFDVFFLEEDGAFSGCFCLEHERPFSFLPVLDYATFLLGVSTSLQAWRSRTFLYAVKSMTPLTNTFPPGLFKCNLASPFFVSRLPGFLPLGLTVIIWSDSFKRGSECIKMGTSVTLSSEATASRCPAPAFGNRGTVDGS